MHPTRSCLQESEKKLKIQNSPSYSSSPFILDKILIYEDEEEKYQVRSPESDLVKRVLAKNLQPSKLIAKEVMSTPLITIDPDETLTETARRMSKLKVQRLGVMYKRNLVGIIASKDILAITPELLENMQEKARIQQGAEVEEDGSEASPLAGYCEQCGSWSDNLDEIEGNLLCEECQMGL